MPPTIRKRTPPKRNSDRIVTRGIVTGGFREGWSSTGIERNDPAGEARGIGTRPPEEVS